MATDSPPEKTTKRPPEWLAEAPAGMWYELREGKDLPCVARWRASDGKKKAKSFADPRQRAHFAAAWVKQRVQFGKAARVVDADTVRQWAEFAEITGNANPVAVAREWRLLRGNSGSTITVADAVAKYLEFRFAGKLSPDTRRHFEKHLQERFVAALGSRKLRDVTDEMITAWLDALRHPRTGEPMEPVTRRHHRKDVNTFLDFCSRVKKWIPDNPCAGVAVPEVEEEDVKLLTLDEGRRIFAANASNPAVGRLALEAFGFLRASSAGRLQLPHVDFARRGLRLRGAEHKSGKTRFRQGQPDNLWAWLARAPDDTWALKWWEYRNEKRVAFRVAGITEGSENRLRKTCISAHLAWLKNPPLTSYLAQHRHTSTTEIYVGTMSEEDGRAWFEIGPAFMQEL